MKRSFIVAVIVAGIIVGGATAAMATHICNVGTISAPVAGSAVRGTVSISFTGSNHCVANVNSFTVKVTPSGGSATTLSSASVINSALAASVSWNTTAFADGSFTVSVTSNSNGNTKTVAVTVDNTAPAIALDSVTAPNGAGWNNTAVTATWNCTDAGSGVVSAQVSSVVNAEGTGLTASGTCTDLAGNTASDSVSGINIDTTPPAIAFLARSAPNANGWNSADVLVVWSCTDGGSGEVSEQVSVTLSGSGADRSATQTCEDLAGNDSAPDTVTDIDMDVDAPTIELTSRTPANAAGWNNTDVEILWTCSDQEGLSGPAAATKSATLADEGADQSASATCEDLAGNESETAVVENVDIDKTDPVIALASRTAANAAGWNNADVTLDWSCTDGLSGPLDDSLSQTLTAEGADQSASAACEDAAGNSASDTQSNIDIDKTAATTSIVSAEIGPGILLLGANVTGGRTDNLSGFALTEVVFTNALLGGQETRAAFCVSGCETLDQVWGVSTAGLTPGAYTATASTDDVAGNGGASTAPITVIVTG